MGSHDTQRRRKRKKEEEIRGRKRKKTKAESNRTLGKKEGKETTQNTKTVGVNLEHMPAMCRTEKEKKVMQRYTYSS